MIHKIHRLSVGVLIGLLVLTQVEAQDKGTKYEATWESLENYKIPDWMLDAKFGIFIHWGPSAVPERYSDWYGQRMYKEKHPAFKFHQETYGDQSVFGYKDLIPKFTATKFNPKEWVSLFKKSGAKYIIPIAEHHDAYAMYPSTLTRWNSVDMQPHRDILGELKKEIQAQGLIFGASSHLAYNWDYFPQKPEFDTWDPEFADLYAPRHKTGDPVSKEWLAKVWWPRTKEIIDLYEPDILWFDFYIDREEFAPYHKKLAAYYYNKGLENGKHFVLQTKNMKYPSYKEGTHMLDLERGKLAGKRKEAWQTDTSIGTNSWYYDTNWQSLSVNRIIDDLVDIVSKNGALLLNVGPRADGSMPKEQADILLGIGAWLEINGEAIFGTRTWDIYGEGPTKSAEGHHSEGKNTDLTAKDIRFTSKGNDLYALVMARPEKEVTIKSLGKSSGHKIKKVQLLGTRSRIKWKQENDALIVSFPKGVEGDIAFAYKISLENSKH
ncbi:MAG: alpha-L-fucosidase [Carboxylicivirga sp.]|jgi:alpha-L-fucosidase|nr:alpha-L-fucosidase [Carboxylicivirga sp.]